MAFFDEGDEPPTRTARSRRSVRGSRGGGLVADPQTVRQRRLIALAFGVLLFIVLAFGVNACLDSRATNRLKDYNRDVATVIATSDRDVGRPFFEALQQDGVEAVELESQLNQLRTVADGHVNQAEGFDVPDELETAHRNLLLTLDMRAAGVGKIASLVRTALADDEAEAERAVNQTAAQMQQFLASDVIYDARVIPFIQEALNAREIGGQDLADSQFLPSIDWLEPATVARRLGASASGTSGSGADETAAPGLHGHGLVSVAVGDVTLQPGETVNRIPAGSNIAFGVTFANQGEHPEQGVTVTVRLRPSSGDAITVRRRVAETQPGQNAEATIPLTEAPPIGTPVTIEVSVARVPGEEKVDNNKQTYTATFTR